jgi:phage gp45-like
MITPYGSVLPSSLFSADEVRGISSYNKRYRNFGIKIGVVINIIETNDARNTSALFPEYDVAVVEQDEDVGYSLVVYRNCIRTDSFGGPAEYFDVKLRKPTEVGENGPQDFKEQNGSLVIINCLDGSSNQAIITGSVQHPRRANKLTEDKGHAMIGEFNGIQMVIDKDGAMSLVFLGATDNDGKPLKADVGGSFFKITANGSIELGDDKGELIFLDKEKNQLTVTSKKEAFFDFGKDFSVKVGENADVQVSKNLIIAAQGSVGLDGNALKVKISGQTAIESSGMTIKAGTQLKAEATQIILDGLVSVGGPGGTPALLMTTLFMGTGNKGAPVISTAVGPFSAKVRISP